MGFDFSWFTTPGLLGKLGDGLGKVNKGLGTFGSTLKGGLSSGMDKVRTIGKSGNRIIQSTDLNSGGFSGRVIQQPDLNPDAFRGSVIQQTDLDNPQKLTFRDKMMAKWNSVPEEKKSAFAQQMGDNLEQQAQPQMASINYIPQDYSWVFQPTRGSMFYGN